MIKHSLAEAAAASFVILSLCACAGPDPAVATLYRNSPLGSGVRVHWATFNAQETDQSYNQNNCQMAARLLNANLSASAKAEGKEPYAGVGFWCESGRYREDGPIPTTFTQAFPTDV